MENQNENLLGKLKAEEKKSSKRMFLYSSIPLIITIVLIIVSYLTVDDANKKVRDLENQKQNLEITIDNLGDELNHKTDSLKEMNKIMELAINYKDKRYKFNYSIDKQLYSRYPEQTEMLSEIRDLIDAKVIKWHLGGNSIEKGFDSPSFAAYMINRFSKTKIPDNERYQLREILPPSGSNPKVGDIVFYEHGYAMFYFEYQDRPFVVGMTPIGLASLTLDFGPKRIGFGRVSY